jgi:uncharacterized protein with FMN-binding domain
MKRALAAILVTVVAVVLLASYDTHPPRRARDPKPPRQPRAQARPDTKTALGPLISTPFSSIQVQVTLTRGKLTAVKTVSLTGDGPHTQALNARAEPILRREALRKGSAKIDTVSGATATSESWIESLRGAIASAR